MNNNVNINTNNMITDDFGIINSTYYKAPKQIHNVPHFIPTPIALNNKCSHYNNKFDNEHDFQLDDYDESLNKSLELSREVNEMKGNDGVVLRNIQIKKRSKSVEYVSNTNKEILLSNKRFKNDYENLASKVLILMKKNSCLLPSNFINSISKSIDFSDERNKNSHIDNDINNNMADYNKKRCPKMKRGFSILEVLEHNVNNNTIE